MPKIGRRKVKNDFEYQTYKAISNVLPSGAIVEYETEKLDYVIASTYTPDFIITKRDGKTIYVEAKGLFDYDAMRKMIAVKTQYPLLDIRMVFYRDGLVRKGSTMRYSDWCNKNGFPFAVKEVPKDWFDE